MKYKKHVCLPYFRQTFLSTEMIMEVTERLNFCNIIKWCFLMKSMVNSRKLAYKFVLIFYIVYLVSTPFLLDFIALSRLFMKISKLYTDVCQSLMWYNRKIARSRCQNTLITNFVNQVTKSDTNDMASVFFGEPSF